MPKYVSIIQVLALSGCLDYSAASNNSSSSNSSNSSGGSSTNSSNNSSSASGSMDLSRFRAAPSARLSHLAFESDGAFPTQC